MIPQTEFNLALTFALKCSATQASPRSDLQGVLFHFTAPDAVRILATDGQRIAAITLAVSPEHGQPVGSQFFMTREAVALLLDKFPAAAAEVMIAVYNSSMIVTNGAEVVEVPETPMAFPSYNSIFEPAHPDLYGEACYDVSRLASALDLCAPFTDKWVSVRAYADQPGYFRPQVSQIYRSITDVIVAIIPGVRG